MKFPKWLIGPTKYQWILMDNIKYRIANIDLKTSTVVLWGDSKTTRIPLYFLTNSGFAETLKIKFL